MICGLEDQEVEPGMTFEYTGRHVEVTPAIRTHCEEQFKKLEHLFDGNGANAHVILALRRTGTPAKLSSTGVTIPYRQGYQHRHVHGFEPRLSKIEKQATKLKTKIIDRKHSSPRRPSQYPIATRI